MKRKQLDVLFLEVEMASSQKQSCEACDVATQQLAKALDVVAPLLRDVNVHVRLNKILVTTEDQAQQLRFRGSPTLRVGGFEVFPEHVTGSEDRTWRWGAMEHAAPPVGLFVDAILRGWAGADQEGGEDAYALPPYLASYLSNKDSAANHSCCG